MKITCNTCRSVNHTALSNTSEPAVGTFMDVPTQEVSLMATSNAQVELHVRREDLLHPEISGNKYRKLFYNLMQAAQEGHDTLLTFGGAFSNHIAATAAAGRDKGFRTIGIIRGEELAGEPASNPTLNAAMDYGMQLKFVSREMYRIKETPAFMQELKREFGRYYLLPEGGTNTLGVKGCGEILKVKDTRYDVICCSVGTGGTLSGLINASGPHQRLIGFPALKGNFLKKDIRSFARKDNWDLETGYHFGGYAKINKTLVAFINTFRKETGIPLDPVYTGKMLYGVLALIGKGSFANGTRILAIHSGGLQGIKGMNMRLNRLGMPTIDT